MNLFTQTDNQPIPPGNINIVDGKIEPPYSCELNVVDHCNLTCLDCNHASPAVQKSWVDPEMAFHDFSLLAKVYRSFIIKVLGGEPLLHPDLPAVFDAIRWSGISGRILLVTNGLLLSRMTENFWTHINELEISLYPDSGMTDAMLASAKQQAIKYSVRLRVNFLDQFRATFALAGYQDPSMAKRVYKNCKLAHVWGCHSVHDGYFYKCPQSVYIPQLRHLPIGERNQDGIKIVDTPAFLMDLFRYLTDQEPLQSCQNCLGSDGIVRPHKMVKPKDWLAQHQQPAEALLDPYS
jgi:cyclic pyranopterin phosphate synthase